MAKTNDSIHILRKIVVDGFLLAGLAVCLFAIDLYWKPFQRGFFCGDESLMYPYKDDTVTVMMLRGVGLGLPIVCFIICEWSVLRGAGSERILGVPVPEWLRGFYCILASFGIGVCFEELTVNVAKSIIGRLRPHFFDLCQPSVACNSSEWTGRYVHPTDYTCTGVRVDKLEDMRKSFPSGHSSLSAYCMVFLALYLQRRMVWKGTRHLRHSLQFLVLMLSWFTALSRVSDFKHHWSDVLVGYATGTIIAVLMWSYGTDVVDKKRNHSHLPQHDLSVITAHVTNTT